MVVIGKGKGKARESDRLQTGSSILVLHEFCTDYDIRDKDKDYHLLPTGKRYLTSEEVAQGWWKFKTNLEPDDFNFVMTEAQVKSFLNRMWEIYRYRKVS